MTLRSVYLLFVCLFATHTYGFDWQINSVRISLSKPQTFHSLIYSSESPKDTKVNFELEPINNERIGVFVDLNGIELGYAIDVINDERQTKTEDFIFSYKDFRHTRLILNYQTLEGFNTNGLNLLNEQQAQSEFLADTKSTKIELSGIHDFYTFYGESLFEHFFLNRPKLSRSNRIGLSLAGGWSYKRLSLETDSNLIFTPKFLENSVQSINKIEAHSIDFSVGPLLSMSLKNNVHMFAEFKVGKGYFRNLDKDNQLKRSGNEEIYAAGGGASWTSSSKKTLVLLRGWIQQGRHVDTSFGDLSVIRFF